MILLLALSLWPMASFGATGCCPEAEGAVETAASTHAHHDAHGTAHGDHAGEDASASMADCHEGEASSSAHEGCSAECAARCATPNLMLGLALWPASMSPPQPLASWHADRAPRPQGARLLRPPIHA